jgi:hypothetical protein
MHHSDNESLIMADGETMFYPRNNGQYRDVGDLHTGLAKYWQEAVFDDLYFERFVYEDGFDSETERVSVQGPDGRYELDYDQYEQVWSDAIQGMNLHESHVVDVEFIPEQGRHSSHQATVATYTIAKDLGILEEVETMTPMIGVAQFKNVGGEDYDAGIRTNPGKWRITGMYKDNTATWAGRDDFLPYKMVYIEPDDLYED